MAGLLEGLGVIFGTAGAQGAKAYGESVAEQAKQEALSIREENMLRIKDIMDRGRQQEQNKFTSKEKELDRGAAEKLANKQIEANASERGADRLLTQTMFNMGREADAASEKEKREFQLKHLEKVDELARERDRINREVTDKDARARIEIQYKQALELQKLAQDAPGATMKLYKDLENIPGIDQEKALQYVISGISGEKQDKTNYINAFRALLDAATETAKTTMTAVTDEQIKNLSRKASEMSGYVPKTVKPAAAEEESPLAAAYKAVNGGKASATKMPLLSSHTQTPFQKSTLKK